MPVAAYTSYRLKVSDIHELYIEESGNPDGVPVVFLHGGPGGGFSDKHRDLFDPKFYRAILLDQRGAGKSTPHACLEENTTWDLVADLETIREKLGIEKWLVFGGSWGSTLALAYAQTHPNRVTGLMLRGIFLCTPEELHWFYQKGCDWIYPDRWEAYEAQIPEAERGDMIHAYYKRLTDPNPKVALAAAKAWSGWEGATCKLIPDDAVVADFEEDHHALAMARIECHYFVNNAFLKPNQLLNDAHKLAHIPTRIVHGRYDVICPAKNAWELAKRMPHAKLNIVPDAGHAYNEPGIKAALLAALDEFKTL